MSRDRVTPCHLIIVAFVYLLHFLLSFHFQQTLFLLRIKGLSFIFYRQRVHHRRSGKIANKKGLNFVNFVFQKLGSLKEVTQKSCYGKMVQLYLAQTDSGLFCSSGSIGNQQPPYLQSAVRQLHLNNNKKAKYNETDQEQKIKH